MKNFYELLSVERSAPADEIKKAFRREIARYHPDKVQHLGLEFQEMAAGIAADLTEAYRILMEPALRASYDEDLTQESPARQAAASPQAAAPPPPAPAESARPHERAEPAPPPRAANTAGVEFVKRATLAKVREAVADVFGDAEPLAISGFDLAIVTRPKKVLFRKADESICVLVKFVGQVSPDAVAAAWPRAVKASAPGASSCALLLLGTLVAPARELAAAVNEQRRKLRAGGPIVVPVDVRDWEALFPPETPSQIRTLLERLKRDQR